MYRLVDVPYMLVYIIPLMYICIDWIITGVTVFKALQSGGQHKSTMTKFTIHSFQKQRLKLNLIKRYFELISYYYFQELSLTLSFSLSVSLHLFSRHNSRGGIVKKGRQRVSFHSLSSLFSSVQTRIPLFTDISERKESETVSCFYCFCGESGESKSTLSFSFSLFLSPSLSSLLLLFTQPMHKCMRERERKRQGEMQKERERKTL